MQRELLKRISQPLKQWSKIFGLSYTQTRKLAIEENVIKDAHLDKIELELLELLKMCIEVRKERRK